MKHILERFMVHLEGKVFQIIIQIKIKTKFLRENFIFIKNSDNLWKLIK